MELTLISRSLATGSYRDGANLRELVVKVRAVLEPREPGLVFRGLDREATPETSGQVVDPDAAPGRLQL